MTQTQTSITVSDMRYSHTDEDLQLLVHDAM